MLYIIYIYTVGERSTGEQAERDQGVGRGSSGNTLAGDEGTNSQQSIYFNDTTGPRREMVAGGVGHPYGTVKLWILCLNVSAVENTK